MFRCRVEPLRATDLDQESYMLGIRIGCLWRQPFDSALALVGLFLLCITGILPITALLVRASSPGGIIFRQNRIGFRDTEFELLKFRTMVPDASDDGRNDVSSGNPRLIKLGRFPLGLVLRVTRLDEQLNFINVLREQMAIVGPRPFVPARLEEAKRHGHKPWTVRPGLFSIVLALYGHNAKEHICGWSCRIISEQQYPKRKSVLYDLYIICRTFFALLRLVDTSLQTGLEGQLKEFKTGAD